MNLLQLEPKEAQELSSDLRETNCKNLRRRRRVVGLSLLGSASLGLVAAYQMGMIKHLPEPRLPYLDAEKVDASAEAYEWLSTPDAVLGIASYGVTMVLAAMGGSDRATTQPYIPLAHVAKVALDVFNAGRLTLSQWTKHRSFCMWCLIAAGATFASAPPAIAEAREAVRSLRNSLDLRKAA